jgi:hypothetical protein
MSCAKSPEPVQDCQLCGTVTNSFSNLLGHKVCSTCQRTYTLKRIHAFLMDFGFLVLPCCGWLLLDIDFMARLVLCIPFIILWLTRDCMCLLPGKHLAGLRAKSGHKLSLNIWFSVLRNILLLIPPINIIWFIQMLKQGYPSFETKCRLCISWNKYDKHPIFAIPWSKESVLIIQEAEILIEQAMLFEAKSNFYEAAKLYKRIITEYPESDAARSAKERIAKLP